MQKITQRIIDILKSVPYGKVISYGQVAELAGLKNGARQVVRILHIYSEKLNLPWHRVISKDGFIVIKNPYGNALQKILLQQEGIEIDQDGKIDLKKYGLINK
ncbi:MAG: MGMT family protein [Spirochaetes bacterium]|nr:MGMT family protein [Spirochaetota bacterium]